MSCTLSLATVDGDVTYDEDHKEEAPDRGQLEQVEDEEALDKEKLEPVEDEDDEEGLDRGQLEQGEGVPEVGDIMMTAGVRNHEDDDHEDCDD